MSRVVIGTIIALDIIGNIHRKRLRQRLIDTMLEGLADLEPVYLETKNAIWARRCLEYYALYRDCLERDPLSIPIAVILDMQRPPSPDLSLDELITDIELFNTPGEK